MTKLDELDIPAVNDPDRLAELDVPLIEIGDTIVVKVDGRTFEEEVSRVDTYSSDVVPERVIEFTVNSKLEIDGPDWEEWRGSIVEEPEGIYRCGMLYSNGSGSRKEAFTGLESIEVV